MQKDEEPVIAPTHGIVNSGDQNGGEKKSTRAFSKISRELSEDDLKSPGTQRLLLNEIDQFEECKTELDKYRTLYFERNTDCAVYEEKLKSNATLEVATSSLLALGPALMSLSPSITNKEGEWYYLSTIILILGLVMLIGGITAKIIKHYL